MFGGEENVSDHYYSKKPQSKSDQRSIEVWVCQEKLRFVTEAGVFSKSDIDFGSRLLIETIVDESKSKDVQGQHWLDLGCGYGAIGVSLLRQIQRLNISMLDINERALECARENLKFHQITNARIIQSDGLSAVADERFDRIVTNPPIRAGKQMIHSWYEQAHRVLNENGQLWLVIQKKQGAPSTWEKLKSIFPIVEEMAREKGYSIFRAIK